MSYPHETHVFAHRGFFVAFGLFAGHGGCQGVPRGWTSVLLGGILLGIINVCVKKFFTWGDVSLCRVFSHGILMSGFYSETVWMRGSI